MYQHKLLYVEFKNTKKYFYKGAWHFFANLPSIGLLIYPFTITLTQLIK